MTDKTPVVMISYNRPDLVRMTMKNVALADGASERDIFMYIDGPRNEKDKVKQNEIASIVGSYADRLPRISIIRRDHNFGCRNNIVDAITSVINRFGRAIIVEDDILVSRTFFRYMDMALDTYSDDSSIWAIDAYQHPNLKIPKNYPFDVYLSRFFMCWGWGTWANRWNAVDFEMRDWVTLKYDDKVVEKLNHAGNNLIPMVESQLAGRLKTWDVQCMYYVAKNNLFCVEPKYQLSKNIGYLPSNDGEHCNGVCPHVTRQKYYNFLPRVMKDLTIDVRIDNQFRELSVTHSIFRRAFRKFLRGLDYFKMPNMDPKEVLA